MPPSLSQHIKRSLKAITLLVRQRSCDEQSITISRNMTTNRLSDLITTTSPNLRRTNRTKPNPPTSLNTTEMSDTFTNPDRNRTSINLSPTPFTSINSRDISKNLAE
jgi:hypothetical protein